MCKPECLRISPAYQTWGVGGKLSTSTRLAKHVRSRLVCLAVLLLAALALGGGQVSPVHASPAAPPDGQAAVRPAAPAALRQFTSQAQLVSRVERAAGFGIGEDDASRPLFMNPTLTWNTFLGGTDLEGGNAVAIDGNGNVYVTGRGWGTWGSPVRPYTTGSFDAFVAKLSPNGELIWNTFLGGIQDDEGYAIAVDGNGNIYVAGFTGDTWGSPVQGYSGGPDGFAAKLSPSGGLLWNTFLGSSAYDFGYGIAVDANGNVYVSGESYATWGSPLRAYSGGYSDAFLAKLSPSGALTWNTFLGGGGSGADRSYSVTTDGSGNAYVTGYSSSNWGSPIQSFHGGTDAIVVKVTPSGAIAWNTFVGGSGYEHADDIAVDGGGNIYLSGDSFGAWGSPIRPFTGGERDAFAAKLNSSGALLWNTFLGGSGVDYAMAVAVNGNGKAYVMGYSDGTWGSPVWPYHGGYFDAYAVELGSTGALNWQTFVGGSGDERGFAGAVDANSNIYVTGSSNGTWGSPVRPYSSSLDAFVAKIQTTFIASHWVYLPMLRR